MLIAMLPTSVWRITNDCLVVPWAAPMHDEDFGIDCSDTVNHRNAAQVPTQVASKQPSDTPSQ